MLNDRSLFYVFTDIADPLPLIPAHLMYGRRIVAVPHHVDDQEELMDPSYMSDQGMRTL